MPTTIIPNGQSTQYDISGNLGSYILEKGTTMSVVNDDGITIASDAFGNTLTINGSLTVQGNSTYFGIIDYGTDSLIKVGASGHIDGKAEGIYFQNDGGRLDNLGVVEGGSGVYTLGTGVTINNLNTITGDDYGIYGVGTVTIINHAGAKISGVDDPAIGLGNTGGTNLIRNDGSIVGGTGEYGIYGSTGADKIINHGSIKGDVVLNGGADIFDGRGGTVKGDVNGGGGNDLYIIDDAKTHLIEGSGGGYDTVKSTVSFTLADYVDEGRLLGSKDLKLVGNDLSSVLYGNTGDNRIIGGGGTDFINGGRGNDILTGSDGTTVDIGDIFIFNKFCGKDTITDFQDGSDLINLGNYKGIDSYADLAGHIKQVGDDVVITLVGADEITLQHTSKGSINGADFTF